MKNHDWVLTRKKLLRQIKLQVQRRLGEPQKELRQYAKKLSREFHGPWKISDHRELMRVLEGCRVVFGSDFHAYSQSQRAHLRLLREVSPQHKIVLAMECFNREDQKWIDRYLKGRLSEAAFLRRIHWQESWGFPWENYKPLVELAALRGYRIVGLSRATDRHGRAALKARDRRMAKDVHELRQSHPDALIYVLVGELHLALNHLPSGWRRLDPRSPFCVIYQDAETLYFRLAEQAKEDRVELLRKGSRFCLMVSPPWVKWQSYLVYLERAFDQDLDGDIDYSDHVRQLVRLLTAEFGWRVDTRPLQVFSPTSRRAFQLLRRKLPAPWRALLDYHLLSERSFCWPQSGLLFLPRASLNHASEIAGKYIHAMLSKAKQPPWNYPEDYLQMIWVEAVGFFFSKWINPKRKSDDLGSLKLQLATLSPRDRGREALLLSLDQKMSEYVLLKKGASRAVTFRPRKASAYLDSARIVGAMMGERLYVNVRSGAVSPDQLGELLNAPLKQNHFREFYEGVVKRLS